MSAREPRRSSWISLINYREPIDDFSIERHLPTFVKKKKLNISLGYKVDPTSMTESSLITYK